MKYFMLAFPVALIALMSFAPAGPQKPQMAQPSLDEWGRDRLAWTCDFKEEDSDGFDKICAYDCAGWRKEIKVDRYDDCPSSIKE
ncbi:hypothetical protein [Martelella radicis]|uniref:Uncharacterized protein n=1 Tax=Martelella radicis TaxID=1397476 RepID=A0A7W6KL36_9HYPH|nr:hypothetical protein [Martelella radicis]MBB4121883.1 hypothetical protein [Martelella radicis]